jgi:hypothetical protein
MNTTLLRFAAALSAVIFSLSVNAATITDGFTFAVASGSDTNIGTHFHSNTGGAFGNPAGKAEVGRYSTEGVRGLSEYSLIGLSTASSAFVTFNVFSAGGLFPGVNDFPFLGNISIFSYLGNSTEDISDYQAASTGSIGSFSTAGLLVGNILSFDITGIFNAAILAGDTSLGIRLQADPLNDAGAWVFDTFRLTTDNQSNVPEPDSLALMLLTAAALGAIGRKRAR